MIGTFVFLRLLENLDPKQCFTMDDSLVKALVLFNPSSSGLNYPSTLDEVERTDSKLPEVIYIEDSPLVSTSSTLNGETPTFTPCSSIHEEDDALSVQEVFANDTTVNTSSQPPIVNVDDDNEDETGNRNSFTLTETSSTISSSSNLSSFLESVRCENSYLPSNAQELPPTSKYSAYVRDFTVPCLNSINTLKSRFQSKYELHLRIRKIARCKKSYRKNLYKFKKDLHQELDEWEKYLNEQSHNEEYIAVENTVDNEGPPRDFTYITHNILHKDLLHLYDIEYLVGCNCERLCTVDSCECPRNSGGVFAYDRDGRVRVKPGTPIYECNSRCPCGMSCRNRVLQRGRMVKVAIFRTPNGCGWGVKTMETIKKNQLVTEYVGEAITQEEAEERGKIYDSCGQTYLFDLDFNDGECLYTLDAKKYGNISHFINHSCNPNLDVYAVWVDTLDPNFPRIAFFANREIKVGEELTFDYQMTVSEVGGSGGSPRKKERIRCHCGAANCREYLY